MEDRFGALARQGDHEGSVRVGPGGDEEGDLPPTVGEVDVNVTEVGLQALAWEMPQGDEGLTVRAVVLAADSAAPGRNSRGNPCSSRRRRKTCAAVCRCLGGASSSSARIWSMTA